ncbi:hypothetical protein NDU88_005654 [Pleurodeles waltl]|uniref:Uncharacterized protein n=1 Tax=Pleurodeles waltl TaxID=8319 RepID=A0AAV7W8F9_PLEWA|nr:hypothetical protein NDU88_005654 [Pleurodeles waltl]
MMLFAGRAQSSGFPDDPRSLLFPWVLTSLRVGFSDASWKFPLRPSTLPSNSGTCPFKSLGSRGYSPEPIGRVDIGVTSGSSQAVAAPVATVCGSDRSDPSHLGYIPSQTWS